MLDKHITRQSVTRGDFEVHRLSKASKVKGIVVDHNHNIEIAVVACGITRLASEQIDFSRSGYSDNEIGDLLDNRLRYHSVITIQRPTNGHNGLCCPSNVPDCLLIAQ